MSLADSAGIPWKGRHFESNASSADDGSPPAALMESLAAFRAGSLGEAEVVREIINSRFLIPLLAEVGAIGVTASGLSVDKSQELSIVTVRAPDGRSALPVFSSVGAMKLWNERARPVPASAERIALAAASEGTDLVIIDPMSVSEFALRRPALWAIAQSLPWTPCYLNGEVLDALTEAARPESAIRAVAIAAGDPQARLAGPELVVRLTIAAGLTKTKLDGLLSRIQERWALSEIIAEQVDSLTVQLVSTREQTGSVDGRGQSTDWVS